MKNGTSVSARGGTRRGTRIAAALLLALSVSATEAAAWASEPTPPTEPDGPSVGVEVGAGGVGVDVGVGAGAGGGEFASTRGGVTVGGNQVFLGDWETGDFSQWGVCQSKLVNGGCRGVGRGNANMTITDAPDVRQGQHAARFTVKPGDVPNFGGGERSEVQSNAPGALVHEGDERWYEWSVQYPQDMPDVKGRFFIILQWHSASGSPPLAIDLSKGTVDIGGDGVRSAPRRTIGPIRRGEWVDYVLHVKFSRNAGTGFVEAWENGQQTVQRTNRATMVDGENYLKQGIYRSTSSTGTVSLTMDGLRVTAP
ncbi:polysaccharide lyase [Actinomycetospora rhizophila]|uniref:Polysaccharide lyase n=1 Tax=Actinomycetospora rhizophila TaxID=1416876 RepID=A0ABV9ZNR8_9PSEU